MPNFQILNYKEDSLLNRTAYNGPYQKVHYTVLNCTPKVRQKKLTLGGQFTNQAFIFLSKSRHCQSQQANASRLLFQAVIDFMTDPLNHFDFLRFLLQGPPFS